jgi:hypothetical protein
MFVFDLVVITGGPSRGIMRHRCVGVVKWSRRAPIP